MDVQELLRSAKEQAEKEATERNRETQKQKEELGSAAQEVAQAMKRILVDLQPEQTSDQGSSSSRQS